MRTISRSLACLSLVATASLACAQDAKVIAYTPASVVALEVRWPGEVDREALVYLEFIVTVDGLAADAKLGEGGFHEKRFVDAAMKGLAKARFKPATFNGLPVAIDVRMPVRYAIDDQQKGVTEDFLKELKKVEGLVHQKDFAGAHFHAQWMLSEKVNLLFEYAVLQATLASTYATVGQNNEALLAVRLATAPANMRLAPFTPGAPRQKDSLNNYMLPKRVLIPMLNLRFRLAASLGFSLDALEAYAALADFDELAPDAPVVIAAEQLTQLVLSDRPLVGQARLDTDGKWPHGLSRRTFTVRDVKLGSLKSITLSCEGKTRILQYQPDVEWNLPGSWTGCRAVFEGAPGTEFRIVEFTPDKSNPTAIP